MQPAKEPFRFFTRLNISELTGLSADTIGGLVERIKTVPGSSIYHHTHRFLQQHQYLSPEPPNDFSYWVTSELGEDELGELLSSIDTVRFTCIRDLRNAIVGVIEAYLKRNPAAAKKTANPDSRFHFIKSVSFVIPTDYVAHDLAEFREHLRKITIDSVYFHVFEARLRLEKGTNDFSAWMENSLDDKRLADELSRLDPYSFTMEELRERIGRIIENRIGSNG